MELEASKNFNLFFIHMQEQGGEPLQVLLTVLREIRRLDDEPTVQSATFSKHAGIEYGG